MKVIIPAAGEGTRLRPHTHTTPKTLIQVAGKPILGHILDKLVDLEIEVSELVMIIGHMGEKIKEYVNTHYPFKTVYLEQKGRFGLGHAINLAEKFVDGEPVMINLDDTILEVDLRKLRNTPHSAIGVKEVKDPKRFGIVEIENGFIKRLVEKPSNPPTNLAIAGFYYIKSSKLLFECLQTLIDKDIKTHGEYQLTDGLQLMIERGERIHPLPVENWYDCGKAETLLETNRQILTQNHIGIGRRLNFPESIIIQPVFISEAASIASSIIGPYVSIASGVTVVNSLVEDTIINENAKVENVLLRQSLIGHNAAVCGQFYTLNVGDFSEIDFA